MRGFKLVMVKLIPEREVTVAQAWRHLGMRRRMSLLIDNEYFVSRGLE